jgi:hypothetical protein
VGNDQIDRTKRGKDKTLKLRILTALAVPVALTGALALGTLHPSTARAASASPARLMHSYAYSAPQFPNPYGCYGRADNPHLSGHYQGTVIASGWTICNRGDLYLKVTAVLFRQDCFLGHWPCWWTQLDQTVNTSPRTLASSVATTPQANCTNSSTHLYALVISAEVWDWYNQWYGGTTGSQAQVDCG